MDDFLQQMWHTVLAVCCYVPPAALIDDAPRTSALRRTVLCPRLVITIDDHPLRMITIKPTMGIQHARQVLDSLLAAIHTDEAACTAAGSRWITAMRTKLSTLLEHDVSTSSDRAACERVYVALRRRIKSKDIALPSVWRAWVDKEFSCLLAGLRIKSPSSKKCLVLDLDRTLWYRSFEPMGGADFAAVLRMSHSKTQTTIYVSLRPGVRHLLQTLSSLYDIVVFTASEKKFTDNLIDELDTKGNIQYRLYREACSLHEEKGHLVKDLAILGRDLKDVVLVDDTAEVTAKHPANALLCSEYRGDKTDTELFAIATVLERLAHVDDIRSHLKHVPYLMRSATSAPLHLAA
ncbi:nuclear LIM factor interactor-interacting protein spore-specific form [Achlya hypogyna]|uniref:Nuclear LIM factor interactor-interacting protein spore-specific form n=1 Tax=Achlya hypogyna TaxID=1202772 RepID=A0A1V9Z5B6_ACHHY|nr:nuclear LIM factor interactor-interacting protein spore-specific form [Achlya hypogyna]